MGKATDAVHGGEAPSAVHGAINQEIVHSSTFRYPVLEDGGESPYIYTRYDNPTIESVERKLASLEGADGALGFASGMAAIQAVCQAFVKPGDTIAVQRGVYGGTMAFLREVMEPFGVHVYVFDTHGPRAVPDGTSLVWLESITNPLLKVADLRAWVETARACGAKLCVDATFATPFLQRPLEYGADVVVHSGTKYLGGHTDVTSGFVCYRQRDRDILWKARRNLGAVLDPMAAYLVARGMKTLTLRMERQGANATVLAEACQEHGIPVHYPGLGDPDFSALDGKCAMLTIDLGSRERATRFRERVRIITPAASLGGVESLCSLPIETSHAYASAESRAADGITDGLVRISVGLEDIHDLLADLLGAL